MQCRYPTYGGAARCTFTAYPSGFCGRHGGGGIPGATAAAFMPSPAPLSAAVEPSGEGAPPRRLPLRSVPLVTDELEPPDRVQDVPDREYAQVHRYAMEYGRSQGGSGSTADAYADYYCWEEYRWDDVLSTPPASHCWERFWITDMGARLRAHHDF